LLYTAHTETVEWLLNKFSLETNLILYGDYNLPQVRFASNEVGLVSNNNHGSTQCSQIVNDCFSSLNLYQLNDVLNCRGTQLDLVFSNNPFINIQPLDNSLVPLDKYHYVLTTKYALPDNSIITFAQILCT